VDDQRGYPDEKRNKTYEETTIFYETLKTLRNISKNSKNSKNSHPDSWLASMVWKEYPLESLGEVQGNTLGRPKEITFYRPN
jgi:hypothetical protein